ncbi:MAG: hypothetical protein HOP14_01145, partial [Acidobacteria bacterium]|nr:hypothetical protein [Acidobacteriota bacterium]
EPRLAPDPSLADLLSGWGLSAASLATGSGLRVQGPRVLSFEASDPCDFYFGASGVSVVQRLGPTAGHPAAGVNVHEGYFLLRSGSLLDVRAESDTPAAAQEEAQGAARSATGDTARHAARETVTATRYTYGDGGLLTASFRLELPDGSTVDGRFEAPLVDYRIAVHGEDARSAPPWAEGSGLLGRGRFDQGTARALGIDPRTSGGMVSLWVDTIEGRYDAPDRAGRSFGYLDVDVVEPGGVPGPLLSRLVAAARRAWRRRQRSAGA